jgi:hypothetical protein
LQPETADGGATWSAPVNAAEAGDRPNFPWVAISPDGSDIYLTYNAFLEPFRDNLTDPRRFQGVVRHADFPALSFATLHRGPVGDGRASSANNLMVEFLGDYNFIVATNEGAAAVWVDARAAAVCAAVNDYRASLVAGNPIAEPAPNDDCPSATFGNTDIFGGWFAEPTTP